MRQKFSISPKNLVSMALRQLMAGPPRIQLCCDESDSPERRTVKHLVSRLHD